MYHEIEINKRRKASDFGSLYNYAIVIGNLGDTDRAKEMISEAEKHGYKNGDNCRSMAGIK